jgi:hypothetical protein
MPNDSTTTTTGPWRILVLDRNPEDPVWLIATIAPGDVRPAWAGEMTVDEVTTRWAATATGLYRPVFAPLVRPSVWRIDEQPREDPS